MIKIYMDPVQPAMVKYKYKMEATSMRYYTIIEYYDVKNVQYMF